jgi:membrane protease YdiL (CAAX protease family)
MFWSRGIIALSAAWLISTVILAVGDRQACIIALASGFLTLTVVALGKWTLPPGNDDPENDLRQSGTTTQLALRGIVIAAVYVWFCFLGAFLTGHIPALAAAMYAAYTAHTGLPRGLVSPLVTGTVVVLPLIVLLSLGASLRQLGMRWSSGGPIRLALWIAIPVAIWIWRLAGGLGFGAFLVILLENFMLNGLPEEFLFRGTILSYARCFLSTDWALFIQAMLFALAHYAVTINEEHGRPLLILANIVGQNAPMGLLFALMTLRSRSIAMSTIVHFSIDATTKMF